MATSITDAAAPASARPLEHAEVRRIIVGILLAMLLAALDQTIVATALPTIGRELGDLAHLPWVVTAYLLTSTAVTPLYGKLADIHGRRIVLLIGIGVFVLGSVACALAPTMLALIIARAVQGLGGGGLISLAQTIIADVVAPKERARYQGYIAGVFVTSSIAGPVLGGLIAQNAHWSLIFWLNLPLGLAAYRMTDGTLKRLPRHERPHRLDVLGAGLMVAATTALLLALTWGGSAYPWGSWPILALIGGSLCLWLLFTWRLATAAEPFLPLRLLVHPVVGTGTAAAFFVMGTFIGLSIYLPMWMQSVLELDADATGLMLLPLMVGVVAGATASGRLMARVEHYKLIPLAGLAASFGGTLTLAAMADGGPIGLVGAVLAAVGIGLGTVLPVTTVAVQNAVEPHELGTATGAMSFFRSLGGAIAVAAFGAIVLGGAGLDPPVVFNRVFLTAAAGFALGFVWLVAMEERPLRGRGAAVGEAG